jgi:ABC-type transport system substrate-binding protein
VGVLRSSCGRRPQLLAFVLVGVLSVVSMAACGKSTGSAATGASATPKQGGTYSYPISVDPGSFNPSRFQYDDGAAVLHQLYEGLVRWELQPDGTLKTAPCLAEGWSANADATVWTFKLRQGVMFQAPVSREVTAADVVADLRYLADPAHKAEIAYVYDPVKGTDQEGYARGAALGVEALDRYTVRFSLKYPFSEFADTLGCQGFWVWPADYLRKVGVKAYARHPVGTGPYMFLKRVPGESIDLARNPQWWDTSGGPYIDTVHYAVFGSVTSAMLAFQKGAIDWTWVAQGQLSAAHSLPQVKSGTWTVETTPRLGMRYLCVNMKDPVVGGTQGLALRQALAYGCDRQAAIDATSGGVFALPSGLVPPAVSGAEGVQEPYAYDPAKAMELVKGIGGVTLRLTYPIAQQQEATVASLKASYAKIGITIEAKGIDFERALANLDFYLSRSQLFFAGWLADYPSMDNFLYPTFDSQVNGLGTSYADAEVDALLARARATPDQAVRDGLYREAEGLILADAPALPLYAFADARIYNSRVADVRFCSMAWADLWRAWIR